MGPDALILVFWMLSFKPTFSLSSFTFIKRLFSSSSLSAIGWYHLHIWGYWYFSQKSWFQLVLPPAQHFSWCTLQISYTSRVTIYSLDVLLFLFGTSLLFHVQFYLLLPDLHIDFSGGRSGGLVFPSLSNFPQFIVIHTVKGFGIVNKAEIDVFFLELSCFFDDTADVANLIYGSSAFSKTSLNI